MAIGKIDNETTTYSFFPAHFDFTTAQIVINWTLKIYVLRLGAVLTPEFGRGRGGAGRGVCKHQAMQRHVFLVVGNLTDHME